MRASGVVGKRQRMRKVIKKLAVRQSWINLQCDREHRQLCPQMQEKDSWIQSNQVNESKRSQVPIPMKTTDFDFHSSPAGFSSRTFFARLFKLW